MADKSFEQEFFDESVDIFGVKDSAAKAMREISKSNEVFDSKLLMRLKDYIHYNGRCWEDENPLVLSKGKFPDRISKAFIKILTIVTDCKTTGNDELLIPYLEAMADAGINITIDETKFKKFGDKECDEINHLVDLMDMKQEIICDNADILKERAGIAHECGLSPKSGFKTVVKLLHTKIRQRKNPKNKIEKEIDESDMYINALEKI
jgi:hypothetical protein